MNAVMASVGWSIFAGAKLRGLARISVLAMLFFHAALPVNATEDLAARTVILVNSRQPESIALGKFYATQRGIPRENLLALPMPAAESITWREFVDQVAQPLQEELLRRGWLHGILSDQTDVHGRRRAAISGHRLAYLVVCRGTPLRIHHDPAAVDESLAARAPAEFRTNAAAVDSELSLLAFGLTPTLGFVRNPLHNLARAGDVDAALVIKVARLDGPTAAAARSLVTSAIDAERHGLIGRYYVDLAGPHPSGDRWLGNTRAQLDELGFEGDAHDGRETFGPADRFDAPAFYFGWYAGAINGPFLRENFRFPAGAVALHIHSFSAATLRSFTEGWCGPLVARGIAATFGNVFEPYLEFTLRPDLLLRRLAAGETLGDAAYLAMPVLSWHAVVIGDPLYRPFKVPLAGQVKSPDKLPPGAAGYVLARHASELALAKQPDAAREIFARGLRDFPSVALALSAAHFELGGKQPERAVALLRPLARRRDWSLEEWPLGRLVAQYLATHGANSEALAIYRNLAGVTAPSADAEAALLAEAGALAESTGNADLAAEFRRQAAAAALLPFSPQKSPP